MDMGGIINVEDDVWRPLRSFPQQFIPEMIVVWEK